MNATKAPTPRHAAKKPDPSGVVQTIAAPAPYDFDETLRFTRFA